MRKKLKARLEDCFDKIERVEIIADIKQIMEKDWRNNNVTCFLIQIATFIITATLFGYLFFSIGKGQAPGKLTYPEYRCRYQQYVEWSYRRWI